jgi:hypothetical protein
LRVRPRPQTPGHDYRGHGEGGLISENAALSAQLLRRLASPFFLPVASSYREVLTEAQQAKANAARAEAEAARPGEGFCRAVNSLVCSFVSGDVRVWDILISPTHKRTEGLAPVWGSEFTSKDAALQGGVSEMAATLNAKLCDPLTD